MFWMVAGIPPLPTLPALDWDPTELAEGTGERGDGVPVLLKGERKDLINHQNPQVTDFLSLELEARSRSFSCVLAKMTISSIRSDRQEKIPFAQYFWIYSIKYGGRGPSKRKE